VFYVDNGFTLKVNLRASGGKRVDFRVFDEITGQQRGETAFVLPGNTRTLWTNRTGRSRAVRVEAGSPAIVAVRAQGTYIRGARD